MAWINESHSFQTVRKRIRRLDHPQSHHQKNLIFIGQAGFKQKPSKPIHTSKSGDERLNPQDVGAL